MTNLGHFLGVCMVIALCLFMTSGHYYYIFLTLLRLLLSSVLQQVGITAQTEPDPYYHDILPSELNNFGN